jgi:hypothetical protein
MLNTQVIKNPSNVPIIPDPWKLLTPDQVLLRDWLKLRINSAKKLAKPIQEALGLLYWLKTRA